MNGEALYFAVEMESQASAIARGLRRRDPDLLNHLIEQYQHRLLRYLVYLCGNRELAEDLFQETWLRVLERGHQYDGRHDFASWLFSLARNLTIDYEAFARSAAPKLRGQGKPLEYTARVAGLALV